jgi:hypothetical protein
VNEEDPEMDSSQELSEDEARAAAELVDEAMAPFARVIPPDLYESIALLLEIDLQCEPRYRRMLRAVMADPTVERSGEVTKGIQRIARPTGTGSK